MSAVDTLVKSGHTPYFPAMTLTWHLKAVMAKRKIKAWKLADDIGMSRSALYKLVRAEKAPRLETHTLDALCGALGCQPGDLLKHT